MARRKQTRPSKAGKCQSQDQLFHNLKGTEGIHEGFSGSSGLEKTDGTQELCSNSISDSTKILYIDTDSISDGHFDLAEVVLCDVSYGEGFPPERWALELNKEVKFAIRLKLCMGEHDKVKVGGWPLISAKNLSVEFLIPTPSIDCCENGEHEVMKLSKSVLISGHFDGPDEGVSGLSHLVSQGFVTLRAIADQKTENLSSSWRVQIVITKKAFDVSNGLSGNLRQPWKKSIMNVMLWLRPEATTEEAMYGPSSLQNGEVDFNLFTDPVASGALHNHFDTAAFYEAIKPSKEEPMLEVNFPELLPQLRPYQRRASYWMVQREKNGIQDAAREIQARKISNPLCVVVCSSDMHSKMYYNPFSGSVSMQPEDSLTYVPGGILADEMGLGKTVELLACILAHPQIVSLSGVISGKANIREKGPHNPLKRLKRERVECVCGAVNESHKYRGLWVQCDECDAWQHAECVGFETDGRELGSESTMQITNCHKGIGKTNFKRRKCLAKKNGIDIMETRETFVCETCSELIQIAHCEIVSGATLIVCPAPILQQWQTEIARHTKIGSLKVKVYEGVKNISDHSSLENIGISANELADADIVLTTYDVLRSDLSHDSDRHHGDRRSMRFRKRYPVVPTPLTKIRWWRLCLDEAQMVESSAAAATEMALRLSAWNLWCITGTPIQQGLDDLFGLLRFLRAEPFDEHRWWAEVMKNPYERGDVGAMQFTHKYFQQIMWRSTKAQVADELNLPPQEEHLSWLTFSPIEVHFYRRQHESCAVNAREYIAKCKDDIRSKTRQSGSEASYDSPLSHGEAAKLLNSLLKLRQACCHPQVGSSGLRSLQQSPMTMDEILEVLVAKAKTEGEEALRKLVVALNGLAALAIIDQDLPHATSLYRESLVLSEENLEDFRLDPLLKLHILHNLAEIIVADMSSATECNPAGRHTLVSQKKLDNILFENSQDENTMKRETAEPSGGTNSTRVVEQPMHFDATMVMPTCDTCSTADHGIVNSVTKSDPRLQVTPRTLRDDLLVKQCKDIKEKYMSSFISKLAVARQEFRSSHSQVSEAKNDCELTQGTNWWLDALELVEQRKDLAKELMEKIRDCLPGTDSRLNSSRLALRFQDMSGLKYIVQTGLDALEIAREGLLEQLIKVDQKMDSPSDADIERVRQCSICQANNVGPLCLHCEIDELFQVYENRLFLLKTGDDGGMIASAEEALHLQKQRLALNRFFGGLSQDKKDPVSGICTVDEHGRNRQRKGHVQVSRSPSELEVILSIIKSFVKARFGKDRVLTAKKHLHIFEAMRKEFTQARSLSVAQAQVLRAHDELKMAISRLRLRLPGEEVSSIDALHPEELVPTSVQLTGEKFAALTELSRIKGQLRYLKGLSLAKKRHKAEGSGHFGEVEENKNTGSKDATSDKLEQIVGMGKNDDETCPVCHEKLGTQMMVFPCGHLLCCKCMVTMVELPHSCHGTPKRKQIICPTCRYHTDFRNIAYVDDGHVQNSYVETLTKFQGEERSEISFIIQGSFGTKMEAVTRRILWIRSVDPEAKVLVFSSWNDVLDVLEHALHANDINFVRMKGGSSDVAIRQFKGLIQQGKQYTRRPKEACSQPKPIQVLLLLIRHGANGLNLLEARHVVLIEPLLNPAAEAQAINRVHRIGQQQTTFVHRFIVRDTVEESIYKLNRSRPINPYGISSNTRKKDHFSLTLNDIDSLFACDKQDKLYGDGSENYRGARPSEDLRDLPPAVAAAIAAEKRHSQPLKIAT